MAKSDFTIALAGDLVLTRPWSTYDKPGFFELIKLIRNSDIAVANLETLVHSFNGYPENNDQGLYMASPPIIAREITWAGFDVLSGATNHANDYGVIGTLEHITNMNEAGISLAGVGKDLQEASKPVYLDRKVRLALVSATSTFDNWGKASLTVNEVAGRPGINPVTVETSYSLLYRLARAVYKRFMKHGVIVKSPKRKNIKLGNKHISVGREFSGRYSASESDMERNLKLIEESREKADIVVFSFHSHEGSQSSPPTFLREFAHRAIERGLDIFFSHGPHYIKGIEIYRRRPIFYGLGNFVFQTETIEKLPSQFYDKWNLDYSLPVSEVFKITEKEFYVVKKYWESIVPVIRYENGHITEISISPISLGYGKDVEERGLPSIADQEEGKRIMERLINLSAPYHTVIEYDTAKNLGVIRNI